MPQRELAKSARTGRRATRFLVDDVVFEQSRERPVGILRQSRTAALGKQGPRAAPDLRFPICARIEQVVDDPQELPDIDQVFARGADVGAREPIPRMTQSTAGGPSP